MYRSATKYTEKKNEVKFGVWTPPARNVCKVTFMKLSSPQRHRRNAATGEMRQLIACSVLQLYRTASSMQKFGDYSHGDYRRLHAKTQASLIEKQLAA